MNPAIKIITSSRRRTIALKILPDTSIQVTIPSFLPLKQIEQFLRDNQSWIQQKQEEVQRRSSFSSPKKFQTGEKFLYLGKEYPLTVSKTVPQTLQFTDQGFFLNEFNHKHADTYFLNWYKKQALQLFTQRTANYAEQLKISYQSISLSSANSKWGSCSHDNKLMFNWRLVMAPIAVIDSVIFHELAHILEKNHTKRFWRKVTMWYPSYEKQKEWLDRNGQTLLL